MEKTSWEKLPLEQLNHLIGRQMVNGENATVARLLLKQGAVVPRHFHVSEQFSLILDGQMRFVFDDREIIVSAGEVLFIPANAPHSAVALEDTVDLDFFAPRREDWIRKEDAYLRDGNAKVSR
jgi:quercetin dioxygenase-like cupin family protein